MISTDEALERVLAPLTPVGVETVGLNEALGRVLRAPVTATRTQPPFAASAMDGYAVRAGDASPGATLSVTGEAAAGAAPGARIGPGEALRVFTGAPMPEGADAVLIQEDADPVERGARADDAAAITVREAPAAGAFIRPRGLDFREGETLIAAPRRITPQAVALAAAAGAAFVTVARRPRVAVLALGDELVPPGTTPAPGQIVSSNNFGVASVARAAGAAPTLFPITPDRLDAVTEALTAARGFDLIVTLGGASDGDHDLVRPALSALGATLDFYKIAMRPGKPLSAGRLEAARILGLPGNPVSAMVCAELFLRPAIDALLGLPAGAAPRIILPLAAPVGPNGPREHFCRARRVAGPDGPAAEVFDDQDSSRLALLASADLLVVRPPHDAARPAGTPAACLPLSTGASATA